MYSAVDKDIVLIHASTPEAMDAIQAWSLHDQEASASAKTGSSGRWINRTHFLYTMEWPAAMRRSESQTQVSTCVSLKTVV